MVRERWSRKQEGGEEIPWPAGGQRQEPGYEEPAAKNAGKGYKKWWQKQPKMGTLFAVRGKKGEKSKKSKAVLTGKEKLAFYTAGSVLIFLLAWLFFESLWLGVLMSPILLFMENAVAEEVQQRKKQRWEESFSKFLEELDSHVRLGHSLESSTIDAIRKSEAFQNEAWMIRELEMNVYVADVFQALAGKKEVESLTHFSGVLGSSLRSGGNLHELMQNSMIQIRKRIKMEEEIHSMLTKVKYESRILTLFVPFLLMYLKSLSPNFKQVMYHSLQGRLVMCVCLGIYLLAAYLCYYMTQAEI